MSTKLPVPELARRLCVATHRADLAPGPAGGVPCADHMRQAQLYYGLLDNKARPVLQALYDAAHEDLSSGK